MKKNTNSEDYSPMNLKSFIEQFKHPFLIKGWTENCKVTVSDDVLIIVFPFLVKSIKEQLEEWLLQNLASYTAMNFKKIKIVSDIAVMKPGNDIAKIKNIKNIIAVSSAKGGVGKSTTSINLAVALNQLGANVGVLDADIYGPSIPILIGERNTEVTSVDSQTMLPVHKYGIFFNSIGFIIPEEKAAVWRGPMASKALKQILNDTDWPQLDYLIVDMPPGTGDIQITMAQNIPLTSSVIVTTPQDLSLADAQKGLSMFKSVNVETLGLIENMSFYICPKCGNKDYLFGEDSTEMFAKNGKVPILGKLPLTKQIMESSSRGKPIVWDDPELNESMQYLDIAEKISASMFWKGVPLEKEISVKTIL